MSPGRTAGPTVMTTSEVRLVLGAVTRTDIPVLCADLAERVRGRPGGIVVCHVAGAADVVLVEALLRLRLTARRHGRHLRVAGAGGDLVALIGLLGLSDVLSEAVRPEAVRPEVGGQAEEGEQAGGVEEVVDAGDPPAVDLQDDQRPRVVP